MFCTIRVPVSSRQKRGFVCVGRLYHHLMTLSFEVWFDCISMPSCGTADGKYLVGWGGVVAELPLFRGSG